MMMKTYLIHIKNGANTYEGEVEAKNSASALKKAIDAYKEVLQGDDIVLMVSELD